MSLSTFTVSEAESGLRLDKLLQLRFPSYSRHYFQHLIEKKKVLVNKVVAKKALLLKKEDVITVRFTAPQDISLTPQAIHLDILYEDDDIIIVNKPAGMVVHPAVGNWEGTFANALLFHLRKEPSKSLRAGIVHRLDKETSGVLVAAKQEEAEESLIKAFASRAVDKEYLAIVIGHPKNRVIETYIGRHPIRRKEMAVCQTRGKWAQSICETIAYNEKLSFVRLVPKTGRTHQLRVHLKYIGFPILGDVVYGNPSMNKKFGAKRQLLHAWRLRLPHPTKKMDIEIEAPIPQDMKKFIAQVTEEPLCLTEKCVF